MVKLNSKLNFHETILTGPVPLVPVPVFDGEAPLEKYKKKIICF